MKANEEDITQVPLSTDEVFFPFNQLLMIHSQLVTIFTHYEHDLEMKYKSQNGTKVRYYEFALLIPSLQ
jgi:hypothetical protein